MPVNLSSIIGESEQSLAVLNSPRLSVSLRTPLQSDVDTTNRGEGKRTIWPRTWEFGLAFLLGMCVIMMTQSLWKLLRPPITLVQTAGHVDLNFADSKLLQQLPGVGPQLADRIVSYRKIHGPFRRLEDLKEVHGIGDTTLERLLYHLIVVSNERKSDNESERYRYLRSSTKELSSDLIDLNQAGLNELQKLPGIGPVLAQRILDDRTKHGLYETVYDLSRIAGIKTKTIEKIMPYVKVEKDKPSS